MSEGWLPPGEARASKQSGSRYRPCPPPVAEPLEPRLLLSGLEAVGIEAGLASCRPFDPSLLGAGASASVEQAAAPAPAPLSETFLLHSSLSASKTIYLDFDGHVTSGTDWNSLTGIADIVTPAYSFEGTESFSDAELERIQFIWERVAEDYLPFDVDVTTQDPGAAALIKGLGGDTEWGVRVCIGGSSYDWYGYGAGGVAFIGSFTWNSDAPCFVFTDQLGSGHEKYTAEAATHETGHTLDLLHDGTSKVEYYSGHSTGPTGWAPIMGVGYYQELVQWSKGEYPDANNTEDDLAIITAGNGFGYRSDDHDDTSGTPTSLGAVGAAPVSADGIIERTTDRDAFAFTTDGGWLTLEVDPFYRSANLNVMVTLYDGAGATLAIDDPAGVLDADIGLSLAPGTYSLSVEGVGEAASGFTDYGSLGYYSLTVTVEDLGIPNVTVEASDATATEEGTQPGEFTVFRAGDTDEALEVFYTVAGTADSGVDYAAVSGSVIISAGSTSAPVTIAPIDDSLPEGEEAVTLTLQDDAAYLVGVPNSATVTIVDNDLIVSIDDYAASETTVSGKLTEGDLGDTTASDDTYEEIREARSGGKRPTRRSFLEHLWTFEVTGGGYVTFFVEAYHTANSEGDDFAFEYSTDAVSWTHLLTVTKTSDDDVLEQAPLPRDLRGTVYVRVEDTDRTPGNSSQETIYVDRMFIRSDPSIPGDATLDGTVDFLDYLAYKRNAGTDSGAMWPQGDFDADGDVDRDDLSVLEANFGQSIGEGAAAESGASEPAATQTAGAGLVPPGKALEAAACLAEENARALRRPRGWPAGLEYALRAAWGRRLGVSRLVRSALTRLWPVGSWWVQGP